MTKSGIDGQGIRNKEYGMRNYEVKIPKGFNMNIKTVLLNSFSPFAVNLFF
jgi:hypothetical protein